MGPAWQQGPLAVNSVGHFLTPQPLPPRLRVRLGQTVIAHGVDRGVNPDEILYHTAV